MSGMNDDKKSAPPNTVAQHTLDVLLHQTSAEEKKRLAGSQKALRTFEGDIAEAVAERKHPRRRSRWRRKKGRWRGKEPPHKR